MAMAIPASDMMFEVIPRYRMKRKAVSTASGIGIVTMRTDRRCSRKTTFTSVTTRASSVRARRRVWTARSMSWDRS
jgi:hypothetical protein